jgi:hypothetical protein
MRVDLFAHLLLDIFSVTPEYFVYFCVYCIQNVYLIVVECIRIFFFHGATFPIVPGLPHYRGLTITQHYRWDSSGRVMSPTQTPLPHNTQHSQQTDTNASGGIRTRNPSKRAATDRRLKLRDNQIFIVLMLMSRIQTDSALVGEINFFLVSFFRIIQNSCRISSVFSTYLLLSYTTVYMCSVVHDTTIIKSGFIIRVPKIMFSGKPKYIEILLEVTEQN